MRALLTALLLAGPILIGCSNDMSNQIFEEDAEFLSALPSREVFQVSYLEDGEPPEDDMGLDLLDVTLDALTIADDWLAQTVLFTDTVRLFVPSVREPDFRRWGPYEYDLLDGGALYIQVDVTRSAYGNYYTYNYYWSESPTGSWTRFFVGQHAIGDTIEEGEGRMEWQLYNMRGGDGVISVDYNLRDEMALLMTLDGATLDDITPYVARWYFKRQEDGGGDLEYQSKFDMNRSDGANEDETLLIRSRWTAEGIGRADGTLGGGDLLPDTEASFIQCWTAEGALTAQHSSPLAYLEAVGDPEVDCPYPDVAGIENLPRD